MNEQHRREALLRDDLDEDEVEDALDRFSDDEFDRRRDDDALLKQTFKP